LLSATGTRWSDGQSVAVGAAYRWTLAAGGGHALRAGIGAGIDHFRSRAEGDSPEETGGSLRARRGRRRAGRHGALLPAGPGHDLPRRLVRDRQVSLSDAGAGLELSRYGDESYHSTTAVLRLPLGAAAGRCGWVRCRTTTAAARSSASVTTASDRTRRRGSGRASQPPT